LSILICPDSFKDAVTSLEACQAIARGIELSAPEVPYQIFPVSDGGEGFTDVLDYHLNLAHITCITKDPLGRSIEPEILYDEDNKRAFFAMSQAAGFELLSAVERNPLHTSTYGVGMMVDACVEAGAHEIMIGVGGSSTNDGGTGMASALGWQFLDQNGNSITPVGKNLLAIREIVRPVNNILNDVDVTLLCDVDNPLLGPSGATYTYAAQKGASAMELVLLEAGIDNLNALFRNQLDKDIATIPGAGAAGGFGAGAIVFLDASLVSGIDKMLELVGFRPQVDASILVLTGEGKLDAQTSSGKLIYGIASICRESHVPIVAFCGQVEADSHDLQVIGLRQAICISERVQDLKTAILNTSLLLEESVAKNLPGIMQDIC
jgi:glycerate 2-kinase